MNNPMQIMQLIKGFKNPKEAVFKMLEGNNNPIMKNLVEMAKKGDKEGIENFARNLYNQQGKDFDKDFSEFMNNFK